MASIIQINDRWRALIRRGGHKVCKTFGSERAAKDWAEEEESRIKRLLLDSVIDSVGTSVYAQPGVYMLLRGSEVRYVGRSVHIYRRLADHARKEMDWDRFQIWPCNNWTRAASIERQLIAKYQPPLNVALTKLAPPAKGKRKKNPDIFTRYKPVERKSDDEWVE